MSIREQMDKALVMANEEALSAYRWRMSEDGYKALSREFYGLIMPDTATFPMTYSGLPIGIVAGVGVYWHLDCVGPRGFWGAGDPA